MKLAFERTLIAPLLASVAFVALLVVFVAEMVGFERAVVGWAERDLQTRTELAAKTLAEPLATQDFLKVRTFGEECREDGLGLRVTLGGGKVFDNGVLAEDREKAYVAVRPAGEYAVELALPASRVLRPFRRALVGFALAAALGVVGMLLVFVTLYRQRVRIRELARLEKFRRDFIADFSHELKTPLTGILGAADMLTGNDMLVGLIKKETMRLNALAQDVLDLARLDRAEQVVNRTEVDLAVLVREVTDELQVKASSAGIVLTVQTVQSLTASVDPQLIGRALSNLIENAIRHSGSPSVEVSLTVDGRFARLAVTDHGVGISPEHAMRVFERFHRVDPARAASTGGAGLGLAIVRSIAKAHGGDVELTPVKPSGSRFTLTIECAL